MAAESELQKHILAYLRMKGYLCKRNQSGKLLLEGKHGKRMIHLGEAGWPDIVGATKEGILFGIEVKAPEGKLTPMQEEIGKRFENTHAIWFVARNLDDVISKL